MKSRIKHQGKRLFKKLGYEINQVDSVFDQYTEHEIATIDLCKKFSMTTRNQLGFLLRAVQYVERNSIPGDVVECGVWKGGSALMISKVLENSQNERKIWLYDTFTGMTAPTSFDKKIGARTSAQEMLDESERSSEANVWAYASIKDVKRNVLSNTSQPKENFIFVEGDVAETLLTSTPQEIALLRLDTDWYESTKEELNHLYAKVTPGGVIIIDDYGHWEGSKKAVDEFLGENNLFPLLFPIGASRIFLKQELC